MNFSLFHSVLIHLYYLSSRHTLILFVDLQYSSIQSPSTLSWCCFIPDSDESDTYSIMSVTRGSTVEVFNVGIASQSCISENMLTLNQIENGRLTYADHNGVGFVMEILCLIIGI